jgi:hypothetical protein
MDSGFPFLWRFFKCVRGNEFVFTWLFTSEEPTEYVMGWILQEERERISILDDEDVR